ncbi:MAG TPA: hypothetical protein VLO12_03040 [Halomonas sp.]|nr:hypothetical protein [Halomonas sp.]
MSLVQQCTQGGSQQVDTKITVVSRRTVSEPRPAIDTDTIALLNSKASNAIKQKLATVTGALKPGRAGFGTVKVAFHVPDMNPYVGADDRRQCFKFGKFKL